MNLTGVNDHSGWPPWGNVLSLLVLCRALPIYGGIVNNLVFYVDLWVSVPDVVGMSAEVDDGGAHCCLLLCSMIGVRLLVTGNSVTMESYGTVRDVALNCAAGGL